MGVIETVDRYQREHGWIGYPLSVIYKFYDDRGPYLAALVTYYAFVSLFPLLLLFLSALGFFLHSNPHLQKELAESAFANFPIIGPRLMNNIGTFRGSGVAVAVGVLGTLYGALGAMQAAQTAFNQIYGVPRNEQPNPLKSRVRSFGLLFLLGGAVLLSTAVAAMVATGNTISDQLGTWLRGAGYLVSFVINAGLFVAAFRLLTSRELRIRQVLLGGLIAAGFWEAMQVEGSRLIARQFQHASALYGLFGVVLAALIWIYLQAVMLILTAEINVVACERLWPRALLTPFTDDVELTDADRRVYTMYAHTQRFKGFATVNVDFDAQPREPRSGGEQSRHTS